MTVVFAMYVTCATWGFIRIDYVSSVKTKDIEEKIKQNFIQFSLSLSLAFQLKGIVSDAMRELFNKAMYEKLNQAQYAVNEIQKQLQCCGNVGPSEYAGDIPPSCSSYIIGCNQAFYDFYWRTLLLLSILALVFGFFQVNRPQQQLFQFNNSKIKCQLLK
jgi:hypothetical protein